MALTLNHQTLAQFVARLREAYRNSSREELAKIARWVLNRLSAGDVTDLQLRTAFGLNATQWNNLKVRMTTLRDSLNAVETAVGE